MNFARGFRLHEAARRIHAGGIIAYPTEAVYGLGCDPLDAQAVLRIFALKRRPIENGLILIASDPVQLAPYVEPLPTEIEQQILATWPGPVTWVLPARPETPVWLRGAHRGIAVRVTAHPLAAALCQTANTALVSTSANPAGQRPARTALMVQHYFGGQLDYLLHGATGGDARPSELRDAMSGQVLRAG